MRKLLLVTLVLLQSQIANSAELLEHLRIPMSSAGPTGLDALLVRPTGQKSYPVALINHGSPRRGADRPHMRLYQMLPVASEFARRGWAAVIVHRRGYGASGGGWAEDYGGCRRGDYLDASLEAVDDLHATVRALERRRDVDTRRIISIGRSAGGMATVALAADPPPGLVASINFAGGRGSIAADEVCREDRLVDAFGVLGRRARVPGLWVYAENDHFFSLRLARRFHAAFTGNGGHAELVITPPFGRDGHQLLSAEGIPLWTRIVDRFLARQRLI